MPFVFNYLAPLSCRSQEDKVLIQADKSRQVRTKSPTVEVPEKFRTPGIISKAI